MAADSTSDPAARSSARVEIADNPEVSRYELRHDGAVVGVVLYRLVDQGPGGEAVFVIPHVEVVPELRGQGHSEPFLEQVLADVERRGLKVVPQCGYAASFLRSRPSLSHLLA